MQYTLSCLQCTSFIQNLAYPDLEIHVQRTKSAKIKSSVVILADNYYILIFIVRIIDLTKGS